jgi:tripartite-type tricarboxylate transporter receptor subunit TctC
METTSMTNRRDFLRTAAAGAMLPVLPGIARAQAYPTRPVRIIVGVSAGGTTDISARVVAQWLTTRMGQPFVVENRPGGATNIAAEAVVRSAPDGYTMFWANTANAVNTSLFKNLSFSFSNDFAPVAVAIRVPLVMNVNPSVPANTVKEFIAYAKANPGKINMGSGGKGATGHVSGELFQMMTGLKLQHIPYRGEVPAMTDLISGQVQLVFATMGSSIQHIKAGKLKALAVTTATRAADLPDVPSLAESLPGYEASSWSGMCAPKGTPTDIVERLNKEISAGAADAAIQSRFRDLGGPLLALSTAAFGKIIADDTEKWAKVIQFAGTTAD